MGIYMYVVMDFFSLGIRVHIMLIGKGIPMEERGHRIKLVLFADGMAFLYVLEFILQRGNWLLVIG